MMLLKQPYHEQHPSVERVLEFLQHTGFLAENLAA
jgi:hypothetical protein